MAPYSLIKLENLVEITYACGNGPITILYTDIDTPHLGIFPTNNIPSNQLCQNTTSQMFIFLINKMIQTFVNHDLNET